MPQPFDKTRGMRVLARLGALPKSAAHVERCAGFFQEVYGKPADRNCKLFIDFCGAMEEEGDPTPAASAAVTSKKGNNGYAQRQNAASVLGKITAFTSTGGGAAAVAPTPTFQVLLVADNPFGPESENAVRKLTGRKSTKVTAVSLSPLNRPVPILEAADITGDKKKRCGLKQVSFFGSHYVPL